MPSKSRPRKKQQAMFHIAISVNSGAQELIVTGAAFDRAIDETVLIHAIDNFAKVAHGLVDSLMNNSNAAPTTVLSIKPIDVSLPTPFKLILHAHEAFDENGSFVVAVNPPSSSPEEEYMSFRQACMRFWSMMKAVMVTVARCNNYQLNMDPGPPVENVIYLDTPSGVRLASLTVQM
jgi:hypothetical protein